MSLTTSTPGCSVFLFDILFAYFHQPFDHPALLLVLDILETLTLPYLYLNPLYPHLRQQPIFSFVFESIFPYLFVIEQSSQQGFPVCVCVFGVCVVVLVLGRKARGAWVVQGVKIVLALVPVFVFRLASEIVYFGHYEAIILGVGCVLCIPAAGGVALVLWQYNKTAKVLDFVLAVLLFLRINHYALMALLSVKIVLIFALGRPRNYVLTRTYLQFSLLVGLLLLIFVQPITLNYMVLLIYICLSTLFPIVSVLLSGQLQGLFMQHDDDDDQRNSERKKFDIEDISYFQQMDEHVSECRLIECTCKEILDVRGSKQLKKFKTKFNKELLKIKAGCYRAGGLVGSEGTAVNFYSMIDYIQCCFASQDPDFHGYVKLLEMKPQNLRQQFLVYYYCKMYQNYLQKQTTKTLKMGLINQHEDTNPYQDLLDLENQICSLISKTKQFWVQLLNHNSQQAFAPLLKSIESSISSIKRLYHRIEQLYDQKDQAEYYYSAFRLLVLHEKPVMSGFHPHTNAYILVTRGDTVINATLNTGHLLQRTRDQLIGCKTRMLMLPQYAHEHEQWERDYLEGYRPGAVDAHHKILSLGEGALRVVSMVHILMGEYVGQGEGATVVSVIRHSDQTDLDADQEPNCFYLLVDRSTLDVVSYDCSIFEYLGAAGTGQLRSRLLRANLLSMFANLNREAVLNVGTGGRKLIAKVDFSFFEGQGDTIKHDVKEEETGNTCNGLEVTQVKSTKNQSLNLLLLRFENTFRKLAKTRSFKTGEIELSIKKQKSQADIYEETQSSPEHKHKQADQLLILRIIVVASMCIAFLVSLVAVGYYFASYLEVADFVREYEQKIGFYADLARTQSFHYGFAAGQDRRQQLKKYWGLGEDFVVLIGVYSQVDDPAFHELFLQYTRKFHVEPAFKQLTARLQKQKSRIWWSVSVIAYLFYLSIVVIVVNLVGSVLMMLKTEALLVEIFSSFLSLSPRLIRQNIREIESLQALLQVQDYHPTADAAPTGIMPQPEASIAGKPAKRPSKRENFGLALNEYMEKMAKQESASDMHPDSPASEASSRGRPKPSRLASRQEEPSEPSPTTSPVHSLCSKYSMVLPTVGNLFLKLALTLAVYLLASKLLGIIVFNLDLRHRLEQEPLNLLQRLEIEYLYSGGVPTPNINTDMYSNYDLVMQLPDDFAATKQLQLQLQSQSGILCSLVTEPEFQVQCLKRPAIFQSGLKTLVQYILEVFRKVKLAQLPKEYLRGSNDLSIAIDVCVQVMESRNSQYRQQEQGYYSKYELAGQVAVVTAVVIAGLGVVTGLRELAMAQNKTDKAKNLFKIVPDFMKRELGHNATLLNINKG